jgi:hypothetical protein
MIMICPVLSESSKITSIQPYILKIEPECKPEGIANGKNKQ